MIKTVLKASLSILTLFTLLSMRLSGGLNGINTVLQKSDSLFAAGMWFAEREMLETANRLFPGNPNILWRLSNSFINEGDASSAEKKKQCYSKAVEYAERALQIDPGNPNAHAYLAASLGCYAMFVGGKEKVKLARKIRDALDASIALDANNQVAHTIYGTWHREVACVGWLERNLAELLLGGLPNASLDESVRHLKKAVNIAPNVLRHRYELGLTFIALNKPDLAAKEFLGALACPDQWSVDHIRRREMQNFLSRLKR